MKQTLNLFLLLLLCLFLTGCYGKAELDDLAYVIAMGADIAPNGKEGEIQITYQVAIPLKITGENNETGKKTFTTYTTCAPSLSIANSQINTVSSKKIDLSHVSLILYSKELAQKGLEGHVNSLISNVAIRPRTIVAICKESAKEFLENVTPTLESSPARYYDLLISSFQETSRSAKTEILDFYTASQSIDRVPIAAICELNDHHEAKFSSVAVFRGLQYIGELKESLLMGHLLLTSTFHKASLAIPYPEESAKNITITIQAKQKPIIHVTITNGVPHATILLRVDSHLDSNGSSIDLYQTKTMEELNTLIEEKIKQIVDDYLQQTITLQADSAGLGKFAKKNYLTWNAFQKENWKEIYPNLTYQIQVESNLNVSQIIHNSLPEFPK